MTLWILRRKTAVDWDENRGLVVRAGDRKEARKLASLAHGVEGPEVWLKASQSTCLELSAEGESGVILVDFKAG